MCRVLSGIHLCVHQIESSVVRVWQLRSCNAWHIPDEEKDIQGEEYEKGSPQNERRTPSVQRSGKELSQKLHDEALTFDTRVADKGKRKASDKAVVTALSSEQSDPVERAQKHRRVNHTSSPYKTNEPVRLCFTRVILVAIIFLQKMRFMYGFYSVTNSSPYHPL